MNLAPSDVTPSSPKPPADLLAQRETLASCLAPGEKLALELRDGQLTASCQAARPEALTCVRARLSPLSGPAYPFLLRGKLTSAEQPGTWYGDLFEQRMKDAKDCYTGILSFRPDAEGVVVLAYFVGATGAVEGTDVLQNDTGAPELACCLENKLSQYRFPQGGCSTHVVRMPFEKP